MGDRSPCPYTLMHERALRGQGQPTANTSHAAVKLRTLAVAFTKHKAAEYGDSNDRVGQRFNRNLLAAARAYARVADHVEAFLKMSETYEKTQKKAKVY